MDKEEILSYIRLLKSAEDFKPLVKQIVSVIESYGGEVKVLTDKFSQYIRENRVETITYYQSQGFTIDQSILMSMHDSVSLKKMMENMTTKNKGE